MKNKNSYMVILVVICALLLGGVGYTLVRDKEKQESDSAKKTDSSSGQTSSDAIVVDGVEYRLNTNIQTVLFMGIDKAAKSDMGGRAGENGQSDSLNLLIVDRETKKGQILQISRDAMVDIDIYSASGEKMISEPGQIALQYAYGDGDQESCRLTAGKVSELLYGVHVDSYLSLTMEGMVKAADAIGGITMTIPADYTWIDPAFEEGKMLTMDGEMVERYVRSRDTDVLDSNVQRMQRQSQFMGVLIEKLQAVNGTSDYLSLYQQMEPYMVTDMTADEMKALAEYEIDRNTISVPGEVVLKDGHAQYIVDNAQLQEIILKTFYK